MRLKTFVATYLLFLCILYASLGIVSVYMTKSQSEMLKEKSIGEYHSISGTLVKDIAVLYGRREDGNTDQVNALVNGYIQYYRRYDIEIALIDLSFSGQNRSGFGDAEISFIQQGQKHLIYIAGTLPEPFSFYQLDYYLDISQNVAEMRNIQQTLLLFAVVFSALTAIGLYYILSGIFKPLSVVADTSKKIADGQYSERLVVKGNTELSSMALSFNRMAAEIEKQIVALEDEAVGKQQFADNLAHEIRTPLTSIYGYAEYMQKAALSEEEIIASAQYIMDEAGHMGDIANSLLALATLRNYTPIKSRISIAQLFSDISRSMDQALREHKAQLVCDSNVDALYGQEDLIKSMLINLCANALQSCPAENGVIHIAAGNQGENIVLSVRDKGCGIPEAHIAKVVEPFYRVDKARSRDQGGAGLGLTLCKQIAEAHGAVMRIESAVGEGTTVSITFTSS